MRVLFCGVRGSTPAPGFAFARYGGNTSCVAISHDGDMDPTLILDAGTGLSRLGRELDGRAFAGSILVGHLHWDHTHGLPFFPGGDHPDARVDMYMPEQGDAKEVLTRVLSPPHFPVRPDDLIGKWTFHGLEPGAHRIEGFDVVAREIPHTGGRTFGYRVSDGRAVIAYLSDHSPIAFGQGPRGHGEFHDDALELARDADLLIHDAQYTTTEFASRAHYGHSTIDYAIELGERAGVTKVVLFHHDPSRTDDQLDAVVEVNQHHHVRVIAATEGMTLDLRGR
ncbi:MAG TPA: MBL fold metallo-hydrolase [Acidimicrobiales bacterium]|nr:MBL fold metallo-hydrolase [Acidimicrobiales bacterium]